MVGCGPLSVPAVLISVWHSKSNNPVLQDSIEKVTYKKKHIFKDETVSFYVFVPKKQKNIDKVIIKDIETDFDKKGVHPELGEVTLKQLLSTWVVHDLTHIAQITRVMAKQYREEIGPWIEYFRILNF